MPRQPLPNQGLYPVSCPSIIGSKYRGIAMRFRIYALAGAAVLLSVAVGVSQTKPAAKPKAPLTSQLNRPWPAAVRTKHPQFPPALSPTNELKTFHMAPGYQVQLVA